MEITREFLLERKTQFEKQLQEIRDNFTRFQAALSYTQELIDLLDKPVIEAEDLVVEGTDEVKG